MPKPKSTKHRDDVLRGIRDPERYDPKARSFGGPWRMVKCKDGAYVCYELYLEVMDNLRKNAENNPAQSPHDGIHTCSKGCKKPGCNRGLRETIDEQNAQIEALKQDLLEQTAAVRHLRMERIHDLNHIGGLQEENARLEADVERLKNTDPNSITGSTIMSDPAWSIACFRFHRENERAEIARLRKAGDNLERVLTTKVASYEVANASHEWRAAKNYKPSV